MQLRPSPLLPAVPSPRRQMRCARRSAQPVGRSRCWLFAFSLLTFLLAARSRAARGGVSGRAYQHSDERRAALPAWNHFYTWHRQQHGTGWRGTSVSAPGSIWRRRQHTRSSEGLRATRCGPVLAWRGHAAPTLHARGRRHLPRPTVLMYTTPSAFMSPTTN